MNTTRCSAPIVALRVSAYTVPTEQPESDGTLRWQSTTLVLVEAASADATGLGYSYTDVAAAHLIADKLRPLVIGCDAMSINGIWVELCQAVRNLGRAGIAATAISAIDAALWDLKARLLGLPLVTLLGSVRRSVPIYGSGGFTSYSNDQLQAQFRGWVEQGITRVKMKIGRDPGADVSRVKAARDAIGEAELFVDANGGYSAKQALGFAQEFAELGVTWFEEPVSSDDLEGLRLLREHGPAGMDIAAGEYGYDIMYFQRMLNAGAVDVLQADATRCCGPTGFLATAALCDAAQIPFSAHTAPALHLPLACATSRTRHIEYFFDHVRIESMFFDGIVQPVNGELAPDLTRPGLGLALRPSAAQPYLVFESRS
jgi:L-alanine-DL-glutamate epimerase-like enolase superfamily enzyme